MLALPRPTPWQVRVGHRGDTATLARVRNASWRAAYRSIMPAAELRRMTLARSSAVIERTLGGGRRGQFVMVVEDARGPFGYTLAGPQPRADLRHRGEVFELYLHPDMQRRGAGTQLLVSTLWELSALGSWPAMLWVLAANSAGRFYASCGGRPFRREPLDVGGRVLERIAYSWDGFLPLPP